MILEHLVKIWLIILGIIIVGLVVACSGPTTEKKIIIEYTASTIIAVPSGLADEGYTFLVVDLSIQNQSYDLFTPYPTEFRAVISNLGIR